MISVCIPTYNYDVRPLVHELRQQAERLNCAVEILVADDHSSLQLLEENNRTLAELDGVNYISLEQNMGRAAIRNFLADKAQHDWIIFLDCDVFPERGVFLQNYQQTAQGTAVVAGGLVYRDEQPIGQQTLRWYYGHGRETIPVEKRKQHPYASFMTGNFMISKSIFQRVKFDEELKGYGHEDSFFGRDLEQLNIPILHIENRVYHDGLEENEIFILKTEQAIRNLIFLKKSGKVTVDFCRQNKLLKTAGRLRQWRLSGIISFLFILGKPFLLINLKSKKPNLYLFDLYKLGFYCRLWRK